MNQFFRASISLFLIFSIPDNLFGQKIVRYDLNVSDTVVAFTGKEKKAIAVNGSIPMPVLEFTEGDTAEIVVHNRLHESTSLHWHGVHLPNREDGVPFLTQMPIAPGEIYTYRFPVVQNGTYWYHSHSGMQEQIGMYGVVIFHKRKGDPTFRPGIDDLPAIPVILSEWTDLKPHQAHRMLHAANDWFAIRKNAVQSYGEAIGKGHFKTKIANEWKRMQAMDVSDLYYEKFLVNGHSEISYPSLKGGEKVKLRVVNGGASSYFWLNYAGGKMTVTASDGNDMEPVLTDRLIIGVSESYDIVLTIPEGHSAVELLATAEDRTGSASILLGHGAPKRMEPMPRLNYFEGMKMMNGMMKMNGDMNPMGMDMSLQQMDMNSVMYPEIESGNSHAHGSNHHQQPQKEAAADSVHEGHEGHQKMEMQSSHHQEHAMKQPAADHQSAGQHQMTPDSGHSANSKIVTLNYAMLRATGKSSFQDTSSVRELRFTLTGNMNRYVWSMDNRVLAESDKIPVRKGEILRITLYNNSMMRHPMHLHGFDFRILNAQGEYAPMKNVMDLMPMETNVIEFEANREGDWFFHCHILYHMMSGMNRVFEIGDYKNPLLPDKKWAYKMLQKESNQWHLMAQNDFATNGNDGEAMLQNARWALRTEWRLGYNDRHGYETETHFGRYIGRMQWLFPFIGFDWRYRKGGHHESRTNLFGQRNTKDHRALLSVGIAYTLPMLVTLQTEVYHDGNVRIQLMRKDIPLTRRLRGDFFVNSDREYMAGLRYVITRNLGVGAHYDSDMGWGLGLQLNY